MSYMVLALIVSYLILQLVSDFDRLNITDPQLFFKVWPQSSCKIIKLAKIKKVWNTDLGKVVI